MVILNRLGLQPGGDVGHLV